MAAYDRVLATLRSVAKSPAMEGLAEEPPKKKRKRNKARLSAPNWRNCLEVYACPTSSSDFCCSPIGRVQSCTWNIHIHIMELQRHVLPALNFKRVAVGGGGEGGLNYTYGTNSQH